MVKIGFKKLHEQALIPQRGTALASGFDLHALDIINIQDVLSKKDIPYEDGIVQHGYWVYPGERVLVRTGIAVQMEKGIEAQIRPRSGLSLKHGIYVAFGTIDADYTGDLGVILTNNSNSPFKIQRGDRVAQLVFAPVCMDVEVEQVFGFKQTERGDGGFGSTGVKA